jgi:hypothetical protein
MRNAYKISVVKNVNRPREDLRCGRENNNKMGLNDIMCENVYWIRLAEDRDQWPALANTIMNFRVP